MKARGKSVSPPRCSPAGPSAGAGRGRPPARGPGRSDGSSAARRTSESGSRSSVEMIPIFQPSSRRCEVTRRVSMSEMPTMPASARNVPRLISERQLEGVIVVRAYHESLHPRPPRLHVLGVNPVVADLGVGHRHDLTTVGGVGEHLLIPDHPGVETDLTERLALRPEVVSVKDCAVRQRKNGGPPVLRHRFTSQQFFPLAHSSRDPPSEEYATKAEAMQLSAQCGSHGALR
jgi:hypothetical protein